VSATNNEIITFAFRKIGVIGETQSPSAAQGVNALTIANDFFLNEAADGMRIGWFTQTNLAATAPVRDQDIGPVKSLLAGALAAHYGITIEITSVLAAEIADARRALTKRALRYFESDLSELSRPQGGPWGGPSWV